jgi:hypothetical protein
MLEIELLLIFFLAARLVFRSWTCFRRYRGRRVPFHVLRSRTRFSAVPRVSGHFFIFLRARTRFQRYQGRQVLFSCFALPNSFSALPRASGPFFMFYAPGLIFDGTEGVGSRFHVLRARTRFRRYRGRWVPFSCFVLPDSFSSVSSASGPVFLFCVPGLIFDGTEGVGSHFHFFCFQINFRRYRGRRVPFSCFALPVSYSAVPRVSGSVFIFCVPGIIFYGPESVGSRFHVLCSRTRFRPY